MNPPQGANSPTPTPRTDAFYETRMMSPPANWGKRDADALTDFARQLEREHAQLVARVQSLQWVVDVGAKVVKLGEGEWELYMPSRGLPTATGVSQMDVIEHAHALLSPVSQEGQKK